MNKLVLAFRNIFSTPDLRNRVLFTLALLAVYRLGGFIPTPGINTELLQQLFQQGQGSVLGLFDLFSGGNLRRLTIFALGIMPYITASIILQLLVVVWPYLERLQKEGELGRRKITQYTRYLTIILSLFQSFTIAMTLTRQSMGQSPLVYHPGPRFILMTMLTLTTGSAFIMWLGRADQRAGNRQWDVADYFRGNCRGFAECRARPVSKATTQRVGPADAHRNHILVYSDAGGGGVHRVCGRRPAANSGAVREARDGPQGHGRADDLSAAAGEFRRRDSADFCEFAAHVPANAGADSFRTSPRHLGSSRTRSSGASRSTR